MNKPSKIFILVRTIGPYHNARFIKLAEQYNILVFETRPKIREYDWDEVQSEHSAYPIIKNINSSKKNVLSYLKQKLKEFRPEVIFTHGWADYEYLFALLFAKSHKISIISSIDSTLFDYKRNPIGEYLKKVVAKSFDGYLAAGKRSIEYLNSLGIQNNIEIPCDVVDNEYFNKQSKLYIEAKGTLASNFPEKYILCVSRLIEKKNLLNLIRGFSTIVKSDSSFPYDLVIVGSGPMKEEIRKEIKKTTVNHRVQMHEFAQYYAIPKYYAMASALIIPSYSDQWGLVVNEAMACGLPILVSEKCGCAPDLVQTGHNGYLFTPSQNGIEGVLTQFSSHTESEIKMMGQNSFSVLQAFTLNNFLIGITKLSTISSHKIGFIPKLFIHLLIKKV